MFISISLPSVRRGDGDNYHPSMNETINTPRGKNRWDANIEKAKNEAWPNGMQYWLDLNIASGYEQICVNGSLEQLMELGKAIIDGCVREMGARNLADVQEHIDPVFVTPVANDG